MQLLTAAENYLDKAGGYNLDNEDGALCLVVWFDDKRFEEFSNRDGYMRLVEFFEEGKITLVIKRKVNPKNEEEYFYRTSLINQKTADVVNLNSSLWGPETLKEFRDTVPQDADIELIVAMVDRVKSQFTPHPLTKTHSPMMLQGYSFEEDPWKSEDV
jgi:hypothetical protein